MRCYGISAAASVFYARSRLPLLEDLPSGRFHERSCLLDCSGTVAYHDDVNICGGGAGKDGKRSNDKSEKLHFCLVSV